MNRASTVLVTVVLAALMLLILVGRSVYTVYPWQYAVILQFGEIIAVKSDSGLYFKFPWQNALFLDSRILTIDTLEADRFITTEKENLLVDSFIKWRITKPDLYYETVGADEGQAQVRLLQIINRSLRDEIGKRTVKDMVAGERNVVMETLRSVATAETSRELGIEVLDVRIKRVELPQQVSENVYRNMIEERRRVANERRSTGDAEKEKIRATADRESTVIVAEAQRESEIIRGEGDAEAARIYALAFEEHPEFFAFHRSLQAYQRSFGNGNDFLLLDANSDFLRYFKDQFGINGRFDDEFGE